MDILAKAAELTAGKSRFFMPGHKGTLSPCDITEIDGADNLQKPSGIIAEAEDKIREAYGAHKSYISVNGSTGGIIAALLTLCSDGEVIADRQCHVSAINAMLLGRITPHFIYPKCHPFWGISAGITPAQIEKAMQDYPASTAVFVTSPTYYGVCSDIRGICNAAHSRKKLVIVDAAHGAHFTFSDALPECAVKSGADIVINSTHKTLDCLTQGAVIHISERVDASRFKTVLNMLQTTSPSYLLMASAARSAERAQNADFTSLIEKCEEVRRKSAAPVLSADDGFFDYDKTRLVFNGRNLDKQFSENEVIPEMFDGHNAVLIPSVHNSGLDFERVIRAVSVSRPCPAVGGLPQTKMAVAPYLAQNAVTVEKKYAVGKICGELKYKLPPCMPLICPGEIITDEILSYIDDMRIKIIEGVD